MASGPGRPEGGGDARTSQIDGGSGSAAGPMGHRSPGSPGSDLEGGPTVLHVGRIVKPHGLRGDLVVSLTTNRDERVAPGSVLSSADGREFRVVRSSAHRGRFIVEFDGVAGIDAAEGLRDTDLYAAPHDGSGCPLGP